MDTRERSAMKKLASTLIVVILGGLVLTGCNSKKMVIAPELAASDEALFRAGQEAVKKDAEKARLYFRQVIESFPKSFYAQRAKLAMADSYFAKGDEGSMILAASEYREFIQLYPFSPSTPYAQYQIALSYYQKALKPGRDQGKTTQALVEFRKVIASFPTSEEAGKAPAMIADCEERLATHALSIGQLYYKQRAYKAAISRLTEIITEYPSFSKMDEVYFYLADSYYLANKIEEAVPFFTKLVTDFPKSELAKKAQERLELTAKAPKKTAA
jgi:outer membrane protein assembly factor BamD